MTHSARFLSSFIAALSLSALGACQRAAPAVVCPPAAVAAPVPDDTATQRKLDMLLVKVDGLERKIAAGQPARPSGPKIDAAVTYSVPIDGNPSIGPLDARITIVKAQDYACPFCQRSEATMAQLMKEYPGQVRIVYKSYVVHPQTATAPALAACAAHAQGRFVDFNDALWARAFGKDTSDAMMRTLAADLKLDVARFEQDFQGEACKQRIAADGQVMQKLGVTGTPAFYINGRFLSGARPLEQFKALVDEEMTRANALIGSNGVTAAGYYQRVVVELGKTTP